MRPLIVCAAIKMKDGLVVPGVRHFSPDMREVMKRIYGEGYHRQQQEQGFINTRGEFVSREQAWNDAMLNKQIRRPVNGPHSELFSEYLY